eukprot:1992159-Prymnesium_polylepis.1
MDQSLHVKSFRTDDFEMLVKLGASRAPACCSPCKCRCHAPCASQIIRRPSPALTNRLWHYPGHYSISRRHTHSTTCKLRAATACVHIQYFHTGRP